jgi:superfamily II DNA or RNA helicase
MSDLRRSLEPDVTFAAGRCVRAAIAAALIREGHATPRLGSITLRDHQRQAVRRIGAAFEEFGGAVLADATGLGKTYVALALARSAATPLLIAPAALREMWNGAMRAAGVHLPMRSIESLSVRRGDPPTSLRQRSHDLVIVDEAHHARNPSTARYRSLATLTRDARVLLLTATPVHNRERDLVALLALFLGERARSLDGDAAMRCIIRRPVTTSDVPVPMVKSPVLVAIPDDEARMTAILELPPPIPPAGAGEAGALLTYALLRRWASSQGALVETLRRQLARATSLLDALASGRFPSARELATWAYAEGSVQLAFPELVIDGSIETVAASALASAIDRHAAAVRRLLDDLLRSTDVDLSRANELRAIRDAHPGEKIVAFSQFAETVSSLYAHLRRDPNVAALDASGASIAGGALSRADTLARFAPRAQGRRPAASAEAIDLLLTTDLLSEGVNLQDASVVVHLDLPWTPARLEQRVGRAARIGSSHREVAVYVMQPPASAERIVRVEERLRTKLGASARSIGVAGTILPSLLLRDSSADGGSPAEWGERLIGAVTPWLDRNASSTHGQGSESRPTDAIVRPVILVSAVMATRDAFIALAGDAANPRLVVGDVSGPPHSHPSTVTDDPAAVLAALALADAADAEVDRVWIAPTLDAIDRWWKGRQHRRELAIDGTVHTRARRSVVERIAAITRRAPRHLRPTISALAATARHTATARYGVGAEHVLQELAAADLPDEAWLRAIGAFGEIHARPHERESSAASSPTITAILFLTSHR